MRRALLHDEIREISEHLHRDAPLTEKLRCVTDKVVHSFEADFSRIWVVRQGDLCTKGCTHARTPVTEVHACRDRKRCLHLIASSGRYTHTNGEVHRRVPFGAYKIGRVAAGADEKFLTNDVPNDPRIHNRGWARQLGLQSFAGYRLLTSNHDVMGVLALFSKKRINPEEDTLLEAIANMISSTVKHDVMLQTLRESEEKYRDLFENANDGIISTDQDGVIVDFNKKAEEIFGYTKAEVLGKYVSVIAPERYREAQKAGYDRVTRACETKFSGLTIQFEGLRKDGSEFPVELSYSARKKPDGNLVVTAITRDITDRIKAQREVRESRDFLQNVFKTSGDAIMVTDSLGHITMVNDSLVSMLGYPKDKLLSMHPKDFVPEDQFANLRAAKAMEKVFDERGPKAVMSELDWRRKNGQSFPVEINMTVLRDERGQLTGGVNVIRDVSERKRLETELRSSEERYRKFVNTVNDIIFECSLDGRFSFVSEQCKSILGYEAHEMVGKRLDQFAHCEDGHALLKTIERIAGGQEKVEAVEYRARHKDGSWRHLVSSCAPLRREDGRIEGVVGVAKDMTERKAMETRLNQFEKMESLGTLAGGVAHDFNNLLVGILGCASFMKTLITEKDAVHRYVEIVESSANRAAKLTQRLLSFSRQGPQDLVPLDLNDTVNETLELLSKSMRSNVEIETLLSPTLSPLTGDANQLQQATLNICVNAFDAMPGGGKLVLETKNVRLDSHFCRTHPGAKPGDYVYLSVSDTGSGMDKATLRRIFEPFFTTKEVGKGTGLGLSTVYGIAKSHGGYVSVYSEVGKGTTLKLYLPASSERVVKQEDQKEALLKGSETILLVDDEDVIRELGENILGSLGYTVLLASDGDQALKTFEEYRNDIGLVILDLVMPGMDGKETCKRLKGLSPEVKVLISSGYSKEVQQQGLPRDGVRFIQKPFKIADLSQAIREAIDT